MFPVISVVGWHNVGKTTLVEGLIRRLKAAGCRVATIKHAHLAPTLDQSGTDTYRYGEAGSDIIGLVSHDVTTFQMRTGDTADLEQLLAAIPCDMDLVIVEGYKRATLPKLEVCEPGRPEPIAHAFELIAAIERGGDMANDVERVLEALAERGFVDNRFV